MPNAFGIILRIVIALIIAVVSYLFSIVIEIYKDNRRILGEIKQKLDNGEITVEEYNKEIGEFVEKCRRGEYD